MGRERLYGSPTVVVWSQMMYAGRAKIARGSEIIRIRCSREIATGSVGIFGGRAKVCIGCVMPVGSRKIAYRYVVIGVGCSVDYYGLFLPVWIISIPVLSYSAGPKAIFLNEVHI